MENNQINPQKLNYLNVPLSIIDQRWFKSDNAVRAWVFIAWKSLFPETKEIKGKMFNLPAGEMICSRSFLSKNLGITDNAAKGSTDKLKRTDTISVEQESLSDDKAFKKRISRVKVKGIPKPEEPYIRVSVPGCFETMWDEPYLAQLYIYMMCNAYYEDTYIMGTAGRAVHVSPGDMVLNYATILKMFKCKEWRLKKNLRYLEDCGAIKKLFRIGNKGVLVHLNYYPKKREKALENEADSHIKAVGSSSKTPENGVSGNVSIPSVPSPTAQSSGRGSSCSKSVTSSSRSSEAILETPVTDAVKYLFFEKKRNRKIRHLNEIIAYVNTNIPEGFPQEKLRDAMDLYYQKHGEKYIEKLTLLKFINDYFSKYKQGRARQLEDESESRKLEEKLLKIGENERKSSETWSLIERIFHKGEDALNYVNRLESIQVLTVFYSLSMANSQRHYLDNALLEKCPKRKHPDAWSRDLCMKADYIMEFLSRLGGAVAFRAIYENEMRIVREDSANRRNEIESQLARFG